MTRASLSEPLRFAPRATHGAQNEAKHGAQNGAKHELVIPELLAPAGSPEALKAAVAAGADAVYFGASLFNARMSAKNFSERELAAAIDYCHSHGVACHITLNTLIFDRKEKEALALAETLCRAGADALIVADLGFARTLHRHFPELPLHASTQCSIHNSDGAALLASLGFSRVVVARELDRDNLAALCRTSPLPVEVFLHGALCVCQSGQCLLSSFLGGRSGNQGACAQPCRMPYNGGYPLSLKDLCLASHIRELLAIGPVSLKIEGRMKSPDYVGRVTAVYRRLLDEKRDASPKELDYLAAIFSRSGFTDGYFTKTISSAMLGVRTGSDKTASAALGRHDPGKAPGRAPGHDPNRAASASHTAVKAASAEKSIYETSKFETGKSETGKAEAGKSEITVPASPFSRSDTGVGAYASTSAKTSASACASTSLPEVLVLTKEEQQEADRFFPSDSARFYQASAIPKNPERFGLSVCYLPLDRFFDKKGSKASPWANGVVLPPVIFPSERASVLASLRKAKDAGARHGLVSGWGTLALCKEAGLIPHGDFRLNLVSSSSCRLAGEAFYDYLLSPELNLAQIRDLPGRKAVIVYGRQILMTLEKDPGADRLLDRTRTAFPLLWEGGRRLLINALPTYMADKKSALAALAPFARHFLFTTESPAEVEAILNAYEKGTPAKTPIRRIR